MASHQPSGEASKRDSGKRKLEYPDAQPSSSSAKKSGPKDGELNDAATPGNSKEDMVRYLRMQIDVLNTRYSWNEDDRIAAKTATEFMVDITQDDELVTAAIEYGGLIALVKQLQTPDQLDDDEQMSIPLEYQVEEGSAHALGLIAAAKERYQQLIVDAGALRPLVSLLKEHTFARNPMDTVGVSVNAANCIQNLSRAKNSIRNQVRMEEGIHSLVDLLRLRNFEVQKAVLMALQVLIKENDHNKNEIVLQGGMPSLVYLLRSGHSGLHSVAIALIRNIIYSQGSKAAFLTSGALQPIIRSLSKGSEESKKEAAMLIGKLVADDVFLSIQISQRGAIAPLVKLLKSPNLEGRLAATYAIGALAEERYNQAGIVEAGGLAAIMHNLHWENGNWALQNNSVVILYRILDCEDNAIEFVKIGGIQKLLGHQFIEMTRIMVKGIFNRLEEKMHHQFALHLFHQMIMGRKSVQKHVAIALAHICHHSDQHFFFLKNKGLDLLIEMLCSSLEVQQLAAARALTALAERASPDNTDETAAPFSLPFDLAKRYVNNPSRSDVIFLIEGKKFYAHRAYLADRSDIFKAMFSGRFQETYAKEIEIPNMKFAIFKIMISYIYTDKAAVTLDMAYDLMMAADQYLLEKLKLKCEHVFAKNLSKDNTLSMYDMANEMNANFLKGKCVLYILDNFEFFRSSKLVTQIIPDIKGYFAQALKPNP